MQKRPGTESGTPQASKAKSGHANKVPGRFFCLLAQCLADSSTAPTRVPTTQHAAFKGNESDPRPAHPGSVVCALLAWPGDQLRWWSSLRAPHRHVLSGCYTRHRHGSIRRVGLRARTVQGNTRVQPGAVATLRKNKRPLMHRCGYPQGGSKIEDRERTAHSPTRRADPPLERGVRPGPRISEEMGALSDGACLYIGITIRDPSLRSELPGLA